MDAVLGSPISGNSHTVSNPKSETPSSCRATERRRFEPSRAAHFAEGAERTFGPWLGNSGTKNAISHNDEKGHHHNALSLDTGLLLTLACGDVNVQGRGGARGLSFSLGQPKTYRRGCFSSP